MVMILKTLGFATGDPGWTSIRSLSFSAGTTSALNIQLQDGSKLFACFTSVFSNSSVILYLCCFAEPGKLEEASFYHFTVTCTSCMMHRRLWNLWISSAPDSSGILSCFCCNPSGSRAAWALESWALFSFPACIWLLGVVSGFAPGFSLCFSQMPREQAISPTSISDLRFISRAVPSSRNLTTLRYVS